MPAYSTSSSPNLPPIVEERFSLWTGEKSKFANWNKETLLPQSVDCVIIGSGFSGSSIAYHLSKGEEDGALKRVAILEAREFCSGASGRNGGHLAPDYITNYSKAKFENDNYNTLFDLIKKNHIDCWTTENRHAVGWSVLESPEDFEKAKKELEKHHGDDDLTGIIKLWGGKEAQKKLGILKPIGGAISINSSPINPYRLVDWLMTEAVKRDGIELYTHCLVKNITNGSSSNGQSIIQTSRGDISTSKVILATNAYTEKLLNDRQLQPRTIYPVRGQVIRIEVDKPNLPLNEDGRISVGWGDEYIAVIPNSDNNNTSSYIIGGLRRCVKGGEVGIIDDSKTNPKLTSYLKDFAVQNLGIDMSSIAVEEEWAGIMGFGDGPIVGPIKGDNIYACAGFGGHGMSRIFLCAKSLVQYINTGTYPSSFPNEYRSTSSASIYKL